MINYTYCIHISEIHNEPEKWIITRNWFGKTEYRELEKFGNRHAVFENNSEWGAVHYDQHNATSFPVGTVNHLAKWGNEETGLPEEILRVLGWAVLLYSGKKIWDNL